jgi:DNA-binding NarL/FixJ family response regulator
MLSTVRVLIVDDYAPWRRFVALALAGRPEIKIVGEAENGLTAIQKVTELQPDIVTLDIGLPDIVGIEVARQIKVLAPEAKIIFLSENSSEDIVKSALSTGAFAYVLKSRAASDLLRAVEAVLPEITSSDPGRQNPRQLAASDPTVITINRLRSLLWDQGAAAELLARFGISMFSKTN